MRRNMAAYKIHWPYIWRNIWDINLKCLNYIFDTALWFCWPTDQLWSVCVIYVLHKLSAIEKAHKQTLHQQLLLTRGTLQLDLKINHCVLIDIWEMPAQVDPHAGGIQSCVLPNPVPHERVLQFHFCWGIYMDSFGNRQTETMMSMTAQIKEWHFFNMMKRAPNLREILYHADF